MIVRDVKKEEKEENHYPVPKQLRGAVPPALPGFFSIITTVLAMAACLRQYRHCAGHLRDLGQLPVIV